MTKFFNKFKKPVFFPFLVHYSNFWGQKFSLCTTSYRFLATCQNLEKANDTIPRKPWADRRMDRPYFIEPIYYAVVPKNVSNLENFEYVLNK